MPAYQAPDGGAGLAALTDPPPHPNPAKSPPGAQCRSLRPHVSPTGPWPAALTGCLPPLPTACHPEGGQGPETHTGSCPQARVQPR